MTVEENIGRAAVALRDADALLISAGAGMGVDSGLPDFRGDRGFWKAYPAIARLGKSFVEMANPRWFHTDPGLAWAFYGHRLNLYRATSPHQGFRALLEICRNKPGRYFVFTSNVDGHFQAAGFEEGRIEECHGSIHHFQCAKPCGNHIWDARGEEVRVDEDAFRALEPLPRCPRCGGTARPNILMFGDWSWNSERTRAQGERMRNWLASISEAGRSFGIVELGAGTAVATVRHQSEHLAHRLDGTLVRINPRDHEVPAPRHISIPLGAAEGVRRIVAVLGSLGAASP